MRDLVFDQLGWGDLFVLCITVDFGLSSWRTGILFIYLFFLRGGYWLLCCFVPAHILAHFFSVGKLTMVVV